MAESIHRSECMRNDVGPMLLDAGVRRFEGLKASQLAVQQTPARPSPLATHISYKVIKGAARTGDPR